MTERPARSVEGVGLHVLRFGSRGGDGMKVVVVHGGMDRASSFGRVARRLPDVALVTYDRRGYGRSVDAGTTTLDGHLADLLDVVGTDQVVVFGHSLGGVIALLAAQHRPDLVRGVLAFEAPTPWASWWPRPETRSSLEPGDEAERFMRRMVGDDLWQRLPPQTRADRRAEGAALVADLDSLDLDLAPFDTTRIHQPVTSAAGTDTTWWHRRAADELAAALPQGEPASVVGATHGAHLTHPGDVADLVQRTCDRALGEPGRAPVNRPTPP